jgi:hypothetical protein
MKKSQQITSPNVRFEWLALLLHISKFPVRYLSPEINVTGDVVNFSLFLFLSVKANSNDTPTLGHDRSIHIVSKSLLSNHPIIPRYTWCAQVCPKLKGACFRNRGM